MSSDTIPDDAWRAYLAKRGGHAIPDTPTLTVAQSLASQGLVRLDEHARVSLDPRRLPQLDPERVANLEALRCALGSLLDRRRSSDRWNGSLERYIRGPAEQTGGDYWKTLSEACRLAEGLDLNGEQMSRYFEVPTGHIKHAWKADPDAQASAITLVAQGASVRAAAEAVGLSHGTVGKAAKTRLGVRGRRTKVPPIVLAELDDLLVSGLPARQAFASVRESHGADAASLTLNNTHQRRHRLKARGLVA